MSIKKFEPLLDKLFRFVLGGMFIWASYSKIADPDGFAVIVSNYQILPGILVNPVAIILPWIELLCGISLMTGFLLNGSILLVDMMLFIFIVSFIANVIRGIDINCGCFSTSVEMTGNMVGYLFRDVAILAMGIWVLYFRFKPQKSDFQQL